jgi:hypothetical protein
MRFEIRCRLAGLPFSISGMRFFPPRLDISSQSFRLSWGLVASVVDVSIAADYSQTATPVIHSRLRPILN